MEQTLSFIIASLGICLNCHVRTKEITIEAILFEYSRTHLRLTPVHGVPFRLDCVALLCHARSGSRGPRQRYATVA